MGQWQDWFPLDRCHHDTAKRGGVDSPLGEVCLLSFLTTWTTFTMRSSESIFCHLLLINKIGDFYLAAGTLQLVSLHAAIYGSHGKKEPRYSGKRVTFSVHFIYFLPMMFVQVFEELLLDADWSVNSGTWMWLSCSSFFQQFFHVYCPVKFGKRADPNGDFIRRYIPALKNMPTKYIHEPWNAPEQVGFQFSL
jgi:hypothetical protein